MSNKFLFTFEYIENQYATAIEKGFSFATCESFVHMKKEGRIPHKLIVNRVDIDLSVKKAEKLGEIYNRLNIPATFFVRLHAPEYNPFSFENYRIIRNLLNDGHEIGYHSEVVDQSAIWGEDTAVCLLRDIDVLNTIFNIDIKGVASHGGMTGLNNLDFWKGRKPQEFGLLYEGYDKEPEFNLFQEAFYVSDSEWTCWKCFNKGNIVEGDRRSLVEHLEDNHSLIYLLIHSDTYYNNHFYE